MHVFLSWNFDIFIFVASGVGAFDLKSSLRGRDIDAFWPGSMSNPLPFPGTQRVGVSIDWCISQIAIPGDHRPSIKYVQRDDICTYEKLDAALLQRINYRLWARDFYEVIVDEVEGRINYRLIEIEGE